MKRMKRKCLHYKEPLSDNENVYCDKCSPEDFEVWEEHERSRREVKEKIHSGDVN